MSTGSLRFAGFGGLYWSSTSYQHELYSFYLDFNSAGVSLSTNTNRYFGFTVRKAKIAIAVMRRVDVSHEVGYDLGGLKITPFLARQKGEP